MVGSFRVCSFLCYSLLSTRCRSDPSTKIKQYERLKNTTNAQCKSNEFVRYSNAFIELLWCNQKSEANKTRANWNEHLNPLSMSSTVICFVYISHALLSIFWRDCTQGSCIHCTSLACDDVVEQVFVAHRLCVRLIGHLNNFCHFNIKKVPEYLYEGIAWINSTFSARYCVGFLQIRKNWLMSTFWKWQT